MPAGLSEARAELYWTAFRALSKKDKQAVLARLLSEREWREDLVDLVILEQRRREPARSLQSYLTRRRRAREA